MLPGTSHSELMVTEMDDKKPSSIKQIQGTNDSSSISKKSTENFGYFKDAYLSKFVSKQYRRSPLIHRGYYIRFKAIDFIIHQFLNFFANAERLLQVISLGAGFDTTYFRLKDESSILLSQVAYFEIDFENVVKRKTTMIEQCDSLQRVLGNKDPLSLDDRNGAGYWLISCDLNSIDDLSTALTKAQLDWNTPTLILSECAITYMPVKGSNAVVSYFATAFSNVMVAVYEQIRSQDAFGRVMQAHFESLSVPLQSIKAYPTLTLQECRYTERGWENSVAIDMLHLYHSCIPQQEKKRVEDIEPFDEYEEWHSVLSHYTLVSSGRGDCVELVKALYPMRKVQVNNHFQEISVECRQVPVSSTLKRFGHCSAICGDQIVTIGGFGITDSGHKRLGNVVFTDIASMSSKCVSISCREGVLPRMHASISTLNCDRFLIFGGRLTPTAPCSVQTCILDLHGEVSDTNSVMGNKEPPLRWRHGACIVDINSLPHLFIFGGRDSKNVLGDCWSLDTSTWQWKEIEATGKKPSARMSASLCCLDNEIYLIGGLKANMQISSSIYKLSGEEWQKLEVHGMPARYSTTVTGYMNKLIIVGGYSRNSTGLGILDLISNTYSELRMTISRNLLHGHSMVFHNNSLIVLGGGGNCFSFGTYFNDGCFVIPVSELMK